MSPQYTVTTAWTDSRLFPFEFFSVLKNFLDRNGTLYYHNISVIFFWWVEAATSPTFSFLSQSQSRYKTKRHTPPREMGNYNHIFDTLITFYFEGCKRFVRII